MHSNIILSILYMLFMRIITLVFTSFYQIMMKQIWIIEHSIHFLFSLFLLMTESNDLNDL